MLRFFGAAILSVLLVMPAHAYQAATVTTAQEALVRLGYDPGPVDGAWGGKTREAMNALRAENGLPPSQNFSGSSLALIHKLSPGATTLPHPGMVIADLKARQSFIDEEMRGLRRVCQAKVGISIIPKANPPVEVIKAINSPGGFIAGDDDWYSAIQEGLVEYQGRCISGTLTACESIIDMAKTWSASDSLRTTVGRNAEAFEDVSWIANGLLHDLIGAYATARTFAPVEPVAEAEIFDWFKRRIDDYHYIRDNGRAPGEINSTRSSNHAMMHMMPAMTFGALVGDRSMMEPAFATWKNVLTSMRDDGSLPTETRRGARWFHYTQVQTGQLLTVQLTARQQGIELTPPSEDKTVPNIVKFALAGLADFSLALPYAKTNQGPGESQDYTIPAVRVFQFGWIPAYQAFYGDDDIVSALRSAKIDNDLCSPQGFSENKPERFGVCAAVKKGDDMTIAGFVAAMGGQIPHHSMGFHAGCALGQDVDFFNPVSAEAQK